jgi:hypothetical protein
MKPEVDLLADRLPRAAETLADRIFSTHLAVCREYAIPTEYDVKEGKEPEGFDWGVLFRATATVAYKMATDCHGGLEVAPIVAACQYGESAARHMLSVLVENGVEA